ncbi:MAG: tyrosine-type recombinase/integrase [Bacteroidales bacterium]|nr:tyrosine-type recombinase/integrase [Bacteroidales bacterium]
MKPKIFLKRIFHRNEWRYAIVFKYDQKLTELVRSVKNVKWSQTHMCWHAPDNELTLKQILSAFRDFADIDISEIASSDSKNKPEKQASIPVKEDEDQLTDEYPLPDETQGVEKRKDGYDAVLFTIGESNGALIIKFTGRYDREWIKELNGYGRVFYDGTRKEFKLKWSQLAVDSLSDYFSSRGVEVIVKKGIIPAELKEKREEKGTDVRSRPLSTEAEKRVELLRRYLDENRYSKRTVESYIASLELFFRYFHDRDIDEITSGDISEFIDDYILRLGYSASYQNIMISAIKLNYYVSGGRRVSPDSLSRPRRSRALPKVFSKEEVVKIFDATRNNKHKLMLWLIYSCGLRRSEVINIKLSDLDMERGILNIREGKGNVDRMVPIAAKIWEKIAGYIKTYHPKSLSF